MLLSRRMRRIGTLLFCQQGSEIALQILINKTAPQNLVQKLYKSNTTPAITDTEATYTECTFIGYASATLIGFNWSTTQANPSHADYGQITYSSTLGGQNESVYGYYDVQYTSGKMIFAERFTGAPFNIANNGDNIKFTPVITAF